MFHPTLPLLGLIEIVPHEGAVAENSARSEWPVGPNWRIDSAGEDATLNEVFDRLANCPRPPAALNARRSRLEPSARLLADCRKLIAELQSIAAAAKIAIGGE